MPNVFFAWDTAQISPDLQSITSIEDAQQVFEKLRNTDIANVSDNILELGKRIEAEPMTRNYSDDFDDTYFNTLNHINDQPPKLAIELPSPQYAHGEALDVIRPICRELGLVFYDSRGAVFLPNGDIYPPNIAKYIEQEEEKKRLARIGANIYNPNVALPDRREDFREIAKPFIFDNARNYGFELEKIEDYAFQASKPKDYGECRLLVVVKGTLGCFEIEASGWPITPTLSEIFERFNAHIKKIRGLEKVMSTSLRYVSVCDFYVRGPQKALETQFVPNFNEGLYYLDGLNTYQDLFKYSDAKLRSGKDDNFHEVLLLAKISGHNDFAGLVKEYEVMIDRLNDKNYAKQHSQKIWDDLLVFAETVQPVE